MNVKYHCDVCNTAYGSEVEAVDCEKEHRPKEQMKIQSIAYENLDDVSHGRKHQAKKVPCEIFVQFSDEYADYATYTVSHIGQRGA